VMTILLKTSGLPGGTLLPVDDIGTMTRLFQPIVTQWPLCERNCNNMKWPG